MLKKNSHDPTGKKKSREELIQELAELRTELSLREQQCRGQAQEKEKELQQDQEKFSKIFLTSPSFMFISELDTGVFVEVNDAFCTLTGHTREGVIGRSSLELGIISDAFRTDVIGCLQENGRIQNMEAEVVSKTGAIKTCLFSAEILDYQGRDCLIGSGVDITERKRAEEALKENENRLRQAARAARFGIYDIDLVSGRIHWSPEMLEIIGRPAESTINHKFGNVPDFIHPDDVDGVRQAMQAAYDPAGTGEIESEHRIVRPDGAVRSVLVKGHVKFERKGSDRHPVRSTGIMLDITGRKQAEEALRDSEQQLSAILEQLPVGVGVLDRDGNFILRNSSIEKFVLRRMPSRDPEQMTKWRAIDSNGNKVLPDQWPGECALRGETVDDMEFVYTSETGQERWVMVSARPFRSVGNRIIGAITVAQDITKRKQVDRALQESEERFRTLADNMSQFAWITDANGWIYWYNRRWYEFTGTDLDQMQGWGWTKVHHPDHVERVVERISRCFRTGTIWEDTFPLRGKNGEYRWFLSRAVPIRDEAGKVLRWFGTNTDITEQRQAEQALRELAATLEQKVAERTALSETRAKQLQALAVELIEAEERERRRFSELLHDDLQQDLASARFQVQTARRSQSAGPPILADLEELLEATIAKSRRLSHEMSPAVFDHSGLVDALEWLVRKMGEQFGLQVRLKADRQKNIQNKTSKMFLFRAVQELLFNVFKHAGVKTARVDLSEADGCIVITVRDQGRGFDPELLQSASVKAGLGLISLRERAAYLGGRMEVESAPGQGSRFTLLIPLDLADADESQYGSQKTDEQGIVSTDFTDSDMGKSIRVLFADDHQVMRQGLISMIEDQPDIQVVGEAENGRQALDMTRRFCPDVIVMDISMPEMDGLEATRLIKAELPKVRVIGLSMFEDEEIGRTMREAGAESFLSKTASSGELLKAIYGMAVKPK